jgi:hypothetical protein
MGKKDRELSRREDDWQGKATAAAIAAARGIVLGDGAVINMNAPVERLSDTEWGWVIAAVIFAWVRTRAEQAVSEGLDTELAVRVTGFARGEPWDAGAVAAILPELADAAVDWSKPLADWPRETVIDFLLKALTLIRKAEIARDVGGGTITRKSGTEEQLSDPLPF